MTTPFAPRGDAPAFHHFIGGVKGTGNGHREAGHAALETYTEWKSIPVDVSGKLQRAEIDDQPAGGVPGEP
jgi:aldehyde dehydrogenase (NAD+)